MLLGDVNELLDIFKGLVPYYLLIALPLMIIISPVNPVAGAHEFPAYRMQQFDLHGVSHGCRSAPVTLDGRGLSSWSSPRHCVVARIQDISIEQFREIRARAGALLLVIPRQKDLAKLSSTEKQHIMTLESAMMQQEISIPVFFAFWTPEVQPILDDFKDSSAYVGPHGSATEVLVSQLSANGYQIVISASNPNPRPDVLVSSIHGKLAGNGHEDKLPTILLVAHYDSFAVFPFGAYGANSNAAGVAVILELMRLMAALYADTRTHPRYNLMFLLTGAGKMNFQGSKKWLEDQIDAGEAGLTPDSTHVLCLDSVAGNGPLYYHVSKPPKEGSVGDRLLRALNSAAEEEDVPSNVILNHKKINLAEETLAWEHERYSMKRLGAATLSSFKSHKDLMRNSILDTKEEIDISILARNTRIIAEALAKHIFALTSGRVFSSQLGVEEDSLRMWINYLSGQPRSSQLLAVKNNPLVITLRETMTKHLKAVKVTNMIPDKREPEVVFYDMLKAIVYVYNVKPAVFDLILTIAIISYLSVVYFVLQNFSTIYGIVSAIVGVKKSKTY